MKSNSIMAKIYSFDTDDKESIEKSKESFNLKAEKALKEANRFILKNYNVNKNVFIDSNTDYIITKK